MDELVACNELLSGREDVDDGRSSILDCIVNDREGRPEVVGKTDSVSMGSEVRGD